MKLRTNVCDLWVFTRAESEPKYLLMHTSQEKADKWFGGGRFWQIPGRLLEEDQSVLDAIALEARDLKLEFTSIWAVEHCYTIYNRRRENLEIVPVFAAEVESESDVPLSWEHSEFKWCTASECEERINFRGLLDSLEYLKVYITEADEPHLSFKLA